MLNATRYRTYWADKVILTSNECKTFLNNLSNFEQIADSSYRDNQNQRFLLKKVSAIRTVHRSLTKEVGADFFSAEE
jgi:hypothetical protein